MEKNELLGIKCITCIVDRGVGKSVIELCRQEGIAISLLLHGRGTADNEMLTLLGLGENEKDVVMLTVSNIKSKRVMSLITEKLHLDKPGNGIAFSIPLSALALQKNSYASIGGKDRAEIE